MDDYVIIILALIICTFGYLISRQIVRERSEDRRERRRKTEPARMARHAPYREEEEGEAEDLADWVPKLLQEFGIDPEVLFEEEMPEELKTLLPLAKGFINSGGLNKLLKTESGGGEEGGFVEQT
jgi:hypothetical protein